MPDLATNVLDYSDNLDMLRCHLPDAAIDLVELHPPATQTVTATSSSGTSRAGQASFE